MSLTYVRCPSCSRVLTENFVEYENEKMKLEAREKEGKSIDGEYRKLLNKYGHMKYCCAVRIMAAVHTQDIAH